MIPHDDSLPLLEADLASCNACGQPATSWAHGPGGAAVGCCSASCRSLIAQAAKVQATYGPAPASIDVPPKLRCPFCEHPVAAVGGTLVAHNDPHVPMAPHPTIAGVRVANRCPGSGCTPRTQAS